MSGFASKVVGQCKSELSCIQAKLLPKFTGPDGGEADDLFPWFLKAVVATDPATMNEHFRPQTLKCLRKGHLAGLNFTYVADLDSEVDLAALSVRMSPPLRDNGDSDSRQYKIGDTMRPAYSQTWCWKGCRAHVALIRETEVKYGDVVARLRELGKGDIVTFDRAVRECEARDQTCHSHR